MGKSKSQSKNDSTLKGGKGASNVTAMPAASEPDPNHVPDSGAMTTTDSLKPKPAEEKSASSKGSKSSKSKKQLEDVNLTREVNLVVGGKDYVGSSFKGLTHEEAEALRNTVREVHGSSALA